jgi:hypothetical protein
MAVRLSAPLTGRAQLPSNIIVLLSKPQGLVRLEGLGKLKKKNSFTFWGLEPVTFRLVAQVYWQMSLQSPFSRRFLKIVGVRAEALAI